jgi:hypothetical protein
MHDSHIPFGEHSFTQRSFILPLLTLAVRLSTTKQPCLCR